LLVDAEDIEIMLHLAQYYFKATAFTRELFITPS